jgi:predicted metal-dependent RNase
MSELADSESLSSGFRITPRGGAREVGRSCYHLQTAEYDYLVDCGLKQSHITEYPDFGGIDHGQIDAVFLTHAHVDHIGALPIVESRGLLAKDAPVITTRPTSAIAHILLHDSLKIHKLEADERNQPYQFTTDDVTAVLNRFEGLGYDRGVIHNLEFEFGDAGHLLGSAWLAIEHAGRRVLFSGDLGGRSAHLKAIDDPPQADLLLLESTYGDTLTHRSFDDARTELYEIVLDAIREEVPVLIPTFGVGRAQEILQLFREREVNLPGEVADELELVYDGLIQDSMRIYDVFATEGYINETLLNYRLNSGDAEPFLPERAWTPETQDEREALLNGERAPVIVAPSGMLEGGWSPYYLWQLAERYEEARVVFIGYQAADTVGRELLEAPGDLAGVTVSALMWGERADDPAAEGYDFHEKAIDVPTGWLRQVDGMSGHAAANTLLQFARTSGADRIDLVHGNVSAGEALREHLTSNTDATIELAEVGTAVTLEPKGAGALSAGSVSAAEEELTLAELQQRHQQLQRELAALGEQLDRYAQQRENDE